MGLRKAVSRGLEYRARRRIDSVQALYAEAALYQEITETLAWQLAAITMAIAEFQLAIADAIFPQQNDG